MIGSRLQDLVSAQAERTPGERAIVFGDESLTYEALEQQSNRLARLLLDQGCKSGDRVCLFVPKSIQAIAGMLGVLKAGCVYVPIDLESPSARVQRVIEVARPTAVLLDPRGSKLLDQIVGETGVSLRVVSTTASALAGGNFCSDADYSVLDSVEPEPVQIDTTDADLAHLLFTSGSTGLPKGVMITHRNVVGFIDWAGKYFKTSAGEQISGHPPLHFDLSTFDIFGTLSHGATLHLVPPQLNLMAPKLAEWIRTSKLTQWFSVPSILTYMAKFDVVQRNDFPTLKRLLWCGEVLPTPTLMYWMERLPHVTFTNLYGPTEATIASSYYTVEQIPNDEKQDIPIGSPCDREDLLVLDEELQPAGVNVTGEIYIRGFGLSPGYWGDAEKTDAVFLSDPNTDDSSDKIYRTGDLGRVDEQGLYHYIGRTDSQIKSRGHRIELGEIEVALNALGRLGECAVVGVDTGGFEGTAICCAYVTDSDKDLSPSVLRQELSALIPRYMLPARWLNLDQLPKNANGKIDRPKIREMFADEDNDNDIRVAHASEDRRN